jgi:hypothetical protein
MCVNYIFLLQFFSCMPYCFLKVYFIILIIQRHYQVIIFVFTLISVSSFSSISSSSFYYYRLSPHFHFIFLIFSTVKVTSFWNLVPHNLVDVFRCFGGNF